MKRLFTIRFDFPLDNSPIVFTLEGTAEIHRSEPWYRVHSFRSMGHVSPMTLLPPQDIKVMENGGKRSWVHKDSDKESALSVAIGMAIDNYFNEPSPA